MLARRNFIGEIPEKKGGCAFLKNLIFFAVPLLTLNTDYEIIAAFSKHPKAFGRTCSGPRTFARAERQEQRYPA
jgi:hypothetical protein